MININLLPSEKRRKSTKSQPFKPVWVSLVILVISILTFTYLLKQNQKILLSDKKNIDTQIIQAKSQLKDYNKINSQLSSLQTNLEEIKNLSSNADLLLDVLTKLRHNTPVDIQLIGLNLTSNSEQNITLTGKAKNPRAAARFKTKLDQANWISSASINNISNSEDGGTTFAVVIIFKSQTP